MMSPHQPLHVHRWVRRHTAIWAGLAFPAALTCASGPQNQNHAIASNADGCTASLISAISPELSDGRKVYVDPRAVSFGAGRLLIVGEQALIVDAGKVSAPRSNSRFVTGALVDSTGRAVLVESPSGDSTLIQPQILRGGDGRWIVAWLRVSKAFSRSVAPAALVHANFDGTGWDSVRSVADFDQVLLNPGLVTDWVHIPGADAFAFPIRGDSSNGDVALIANQNGTWRRDVVRPAHSALYTALGFVNGRLILAYIGADSGRHGLFSTRSVDGGKTWGNPVALSAATGYDMSFIRAGNALVLLALGEASMFRPRGLRVFLTRNAGASWDSLGFVPGSDSATGLATLQLSPWRSLVLEQSGESFRRRHRIGVFEGHSIQWLREDTVDVISAPRLARGAGDDVFAVWSVVDKTESGYLPRMTVARYRIACGGS